MGAKCKDDTCSRPKKMGVHCLCADCQNFGEDKDGLEDAHAD